MEAKAEKDDSHGSQMEKDECEQRWASIERLSSFQRLRLSLMEEFGVGGEVKGMKVVNVTKLTPLEHKLFADMLLKNVQMDNLLLLEKINARLSRVDVEMPTVEVRYKDLNVHATCKVLHGKPFPTIWNTVTTALTGITRLFGMESKEVDVRILKDVSGIIKPSRMTLVLGPPGSGKTTLLLALSGRLSEPYKVRGDISYNGFNLEEFNPKKTSAYISQYDVHIPEMTVRETLDFSARCQGVGSRMDIMKEVLRKEKQAGVIPDFQIDTFMKAISTDGSKRSIQTDYILKILGLENCSDTTVGDAMRRGISGGQKRRLTTGEIIVGPARTLFMDEISTGLDSSTTFQVVSCIQQMVHITKVTALVSLLQPAPETFNLFDDIIMMAEGRVIYHGPCNLILDFFEDCGFKCPQRKDIADFLQEVVSKKDQEQYWCLTDTTYSYVTANEFAEKFKSFHVWNNEEYELSNPLERSLSHKKALSFNTYSLTKWEIFKTCMAREYLLMKKDSFVYKFKITQITIVALVTLTVFLRTNMGSGLDLSHANYFMGSIFYAVVRLVTNGIAELTLSVSRLQIFYKQRDLELYPAWAYSISASILKIPLSLVESSIWTLLTYYAIGYSPEVQRFFCHLLSLVALHLAATSLFRFLASISRTHVTALFSGDVTLLACFLFSGFIIPRSSSPSWLLWGFWISPLSYAQIGLSLNEFSAPRWQTISQDNTTIGEQVLRARGLNFTSNFYWISIAALFSLTILFNIGFTIALTFLKNPATSKAVVSQNELHSSTKGQCSDNCEQSVEKSTSRPSVASIETNDGKNNCIESEAGRMVLPFVPMTITFQDLQYYIDTPKEIKEQGFTEKKQHFLQNITGACRPGVLTALMGVSGSGKTTLMDVLFGRKTCGTIEGDIRVGGYPKVQETFARISGYCEQNDIHSPRITVEESVIYSAWLRLPPEIDQQTKRKFVAEVLEKIELDGIKDALVGVPGVNGLSTEQRKRLTIAVELVANPSILFMDEPTSGLDARAAAIVMRAVKNITETGRTIVCTIHQPSINIFESFDELILLKKGGQMIYFGPLGLHSSNLIQYFERIPGVPKIEGNYNPATWMLEVTSASMEQKLSVDFARIYEESSLYQRTRELVKDLSTPSAESKELHFTTHYPQNEWGQFKACFWKQNLSYWRNPAYNLMRLTYMIIASVLFAVLFRNHGKKINDENDMFAIMGLMYLATTLIGAKNCSTVVQIIAQERAVLYREKYAGMYSSLVFSLAQVIIEVPYMLILTLVFVMITYPTIGYYWSAYKIFWYFYITFCTLLYYNYLGMLAMSICPTASVAVILCSACYTMLGLFAGFIIPKPQIPKWWVWFYWICPSSWTLKGYMISQYGDVTKEISAFGEAKALNIFLKDYYGFHLEQLGFVALVLFCLPFVFASLFAFSIAKMNFQRR